MSQIKKNKKINSKQQNFEKKIISHINILFKRTFRIFQKSMVKSLTLPIKHYKNSIIFGQVSIGEIENKMPKMLKKIKKK